MICMVMKVYIQRREDGKYLNGASGWHTKEEAYEFRSPGDAIEYCLARPLREVRIVLEFENSEENLVLELLPAARQALAEGVKRNRELRECQVSLKAELDRVRAEGKERKKQIPFPRTPVNGEQG